MLRSYAARFVAVGSAQSITTGDMLKVSRVRKSLTAATRAYPGEEFHEEENGCGGARCDVPDTWRGRVLREQEGKEIHCEMASQGAVYGYAEPAPRESECHRHHCSRGLHNGRGNEGLRRRILAGRRRRASRCVPQGHGVLRGGRQGIRVCGG